MLSPYKISWDGYSSVDFDTYTELSFDSDNGQIGTWLSREAVSSETYNGAMRRVHSYKWNEVLTPTITFIKEDYGEFTPEENRKFLKWITGKPTTGVLSVYTDDSEAIEWELIGNFTSVEQYKLSNERVVGYVCTFESCTPWALSPVRTIIQTVDTPSTFTINCETDCPNDIIYPKITITEGNSFVVQADAELGSKFQTNTSLIPAEYVPGTVYAYNNRWWYVDGSGVMKGDSERPAKWDATSVVIENLTTKTRTQVGMNVLGEIITLDGANQIIASDRNTGRIFGSDFNWQWVPFVEGENQIKIIGNCTVKFEYREPIKTGDMI